MANFTPDEMAAINAAAAAGQLSREQVQYFLNEMGAPMMPPTGAGATTDMELKFLMEMIQRPEVSEMLLGALPKGAVTDQEMQGVK